MSPAEVLWRVQGKVQQTLDRPLAPLRRRPVPLWKIATAEGTVWSVRPEAIGRDLPAVGADADLPQFAAWKSALLDRAERIARNRITLFDLPDHDLGPEINWNYEYKANKPAPLIFAPLIDYRDYNETGDCKFVWEPSRHYHLVTLARAYRVSGERAFAEALFEHLDSWLRQCPFGLGMNWRSPLELAIRMINWAWALELVRPAGLTTPDRERRLMGSVYRHLWEISRKYSRYSSANNHLIGEAAGVFIAASYFAGLQDAPRWRRESREILMREIAAQTFTDGGNREQAFGYHLFVLEFFLLSGLVARNRGEDFPAAYWTHLERMFDFICGMIEGGEQTPVIGDADDGYVLDLGGGRPAARELLAAGAVLFGRGDFKAESRGFSEQAFWLLGRSAFDRFERIPVEPGHLAIVSRAYPDSGYYLLQAGRRGGSDRISLAFDCGELGLGAIAAHGHADALSFTLRAFGRDVLVDPGAYDYFTYGPAWRDYFRSTRAHNTVVIDDADQSEMLGPFMWGRRAEARCTRWEPTARGGTVSGEHDGYQPIGVRHRRTITLDAERRIATLHDELTGQGRHDAVLCLHVSDGCPAVLDGAALRIDCSPGRVLVYLDPALRVQVLSASEAPIAGWVSRGYHRKEPGSTIWARTEWEGTRVLETRIEIQP